MAAPVKQATEAKIPVIIIDSGLDAQVGKDFVSFIATDNEKGGQLAGEKMGALLGGKGKVLMLRYQEGSASTTLREKGFADAIAGPRGSPSSTPTASPAPHARRPKRPRKTSSSRTRKSRVCSARTSRRPMACCSRSAAAGWPER